MACSDLAGAVVRATFWDAGGASLRERALLGAPRPRCLSDSWLEDLSRLGDGASEASTRAGSDDESPRSPRVPSWFDSEGSDDAAAPETRPLSRREGHARRPDLWCAGPIAAEPEVAAPEPGPEPPTTIVLKNLPPGCSRDDLCELLGEQGFSQAYDFLYLPMNFKWMRSFCYSFVNFVDHGTAEKALRGLQGCRWSLRGAESALEATWSRPHQGLELHIERFRNSPVMHPSVPDAYKPLMLAAGRRVAFPGPTARITPPRELRRQQRTATPK